MSQAEEGEAERSDPDEKAPVSRMLVADVIENDFLEKAEARPPCDPEGQTTIVPDLVLGEDTLMGMLENCMKVAMDYIQGEMQRYAAKVKAEGKSLQDASVEELDENLRKQWPRKGRLEVEIYQERKAQITTHNRKYERQVRTTLDKFETLKDEWALILDNTAEEF